ncbi:MAG: PQQ-binding-like beta-propeller repeat protein [Phycisphaeraceae bacterium]|nr:PQQ-binding-like beta-propeller repeat protein [Phycisphaeraceae bacterium]
MPQPIALLARIGILSALAFGLAACASGPRQVSAEERSAATPLDDIDYATAGYRRVWRAFPVLNAGASVTSIRVLGDVMAVQESSSQLTLIDTRSGAIRWSDQLADPLTKCFASSRDATRIITATDNEVVFNAIDTGTLVDRDTLNEVITASPLLVNNVLVCPTASGHIVGHMATGHMNAWTNSLPGPIIGPPVRVGASNSVALISQDGTLIVLDAATGSGNGRARVGGGVGPDGGLAASEAIVFVACLDQSLYAFDAETMRRLWRVRTETPLRNRPVYHDGRVYLDIPGRGITAFDAGTGNQEWAAQGVSGTVFAMHHGRLLAWDPAMQVATSLDPATGQVINRVTLETTTMVVTDSFVDGTVYLCSSYGVITKLLPK